MSTKIDHAGLARMVEFFKACKYSIQEVVDYCWECYGCNAAIIDANYEATDRGVFGIVASAQMIIDRRTHEVFEISVCETRAGKESAFKWHNPVYALAHDLESARRGIPAAEVDQAWDKVNYKRTTDRSVLSRIKALFNPPVKNRKPKKKTSTAGRKLMQAGKRKKVVRRR